MNKENIHFDRAVREKLEDFSTHPSPHLWEGISGKITRNSRYRRIVLYRSIGVAATILMAVVAGWYFSSQNDPRIAVTIEKSVPEEGKIVIAEKKKDKADEIIEGKSGLSEESLTRAEQGVKLISTEAVASSVEKRVTVPVRDNYLFRLLKLKEGFITADFPQGKGLAEKVMPQQIRVDYLTEDEKIILAANAETIDKSERNWKLGLHVSPGYSSYSANHSDYYAQNMTYHGSSGENNLGGGLSVQYKTGKKWSIESGIYYSQNGQKSENTYLYESGNSKFDYAFAGGGEKSFISTPVNISDGKITMNSTAGIIELSGPPQNSEIAADPEKRGDFSNNMLMEGEITQQFSFVEVPFYLRYKLVDSRMGVQMMGGINANFLVGNDVYLSDNAGTENLGKTGDIRNISYAGTVGLGISYNLFKNLSLSVEPRLNYNLNSLTSNSDVIYRPYRIGIFTGINYEF